MLYVSVSRTLRGFSWGYLGGQYLGVGAPEPQQSSLVAQGAIRGDSLEGQRYGSPLGRFLGCGVSLLHPARQGTSCPTLHGPCLGLYLFMALLYIATLLPSAWRPQCGRGCSHVTPLCAGDPGGSLFMHGGNGFVSWSNSLNGTHSAGASSKGFIRVFWWDHKGLLAGHSFLVTFLAFFETRAPFGSGAPKTTAQAPSVTAQLSSVILQLPSVSPSNRCWGPPTCCR